MITLDQVPPHDLDAERAILGACFMDSSAAARAVSALSPDVFYHEPHRIIFTAIQEIFPEPVDVITLGNHLREKGQMDEIGGRAYLSEILGEAFSTAVVDGYIDMVLDKYLDRSLIQSGAKIVQLGYERGDRDEKRAKAAELVFKLDAPETNGPIRTADVGADRLTAIQKGQEPPGIRTPFRELNEKLSGGFKPGRYYIIAGNPGDGKSVFLENLLRKAAHDNPEKAVLLASLEMDKRELTDRQLCAVAGVDGARYEARTISDKELDCLDKALSYLGTIKFLVDDEPAQTPMRILAKAFQVKAEHGLLALGIDYIQLLELPDGYDNRAQEVSKISRQIKLIAKKLQVPVIVLSQMSREGRREAQTKPPKLSDLKESGSLEQDADCVMFIWHDPEDKDEDLRDIIIAKHRSGPKGKLKLKFFGPYYSFGRGY